MSYQSKYTGKQVEDALGKAITAVQANDLNKKQDTIADLEDIRLGAAKGATAVQANELAEVATSGSYEDLNDKPNIPSEVTEQTITDWGFTKNKGDYSKPSSGIPKTDLSSDVQESLNKADSALQEHQSLDNYATKAELAKKAEGSIDVLDNGNIKVTINGVSKDFMPATPSGDPMHNYYESLGAQWNDGEDKTLQIPIYGKDVNTIEYFPVVHKSKHWYFNLLGDITNAQMAEIVSYPRTIFGSYVYTNCKARTIVFEGNGLSSSLSFDNFCTRANIVSIYTMQALYPSSTKNMLYSNTFTKYILGNPNSSAYFVGYNGINSAWSGCFQALEEIRILSARANIRFTSSPKLSKTSILFMVNEASPTTAITITLHPTAYARVVNDEEVIAALDAKNAALQGTGGSVSIVSA